jgi:cysteine-rich repeat protein
LLHSRGNSFVRRAFAVVPSSALTVVRATSFSIACTVFGLLAIVPASASAQTCGNGIREAGEQCDDGNLNNLDGCSSQCKFEQSQRINQLALSGNQAPAALSCTPATNRLGTQAFTSLALGQVNSALSASVADGSTSVLFYFAGLTDPTGVTDQANVQVGVFDATPGPGAGYSGSSDVDWWYAADALALTGYDPTNMVNASISSGTLSVGPGSIVLPTSILGSTANLGMLAVRMRASIGSSTTPMTFSGKDQGHLSSENLDPSLQSFASTVGNGVGEGMCGNVTVASLASVPVPSAFTSGTAACIQAPGSHSYTAANSLLDVIVGGCTALGGFAVLVNATQPDVPANATVTTLTLGAGNHVVQDTQNDQDAYSAYFSLTTDRVIAKSPISADVIFEDNFE